MAKPTGESVPLQMRATFEAIVAQTDSFCKEHLTDEHADLCRKLAAALCRKRPSPLLSGSLNTWACGIVYAIGSLNFLFDKSNPHYISAADLAGAFGLARNTAGAKAKTIRDALHIDTFDWHWSLVRKPGAFANYRFHDDLFPTLTFRRAYDVLKEATPTSADRHYVRILHLAASTSETEVETALGLLLDQKTSPAFDSVRDLVRQPSITAIPRVSEPEIDLSVYDRLVATGVSARAGVARG